MTRTRPLFKYNSEVTASEFNEQSGRWLGQSWYQQSNGKNFVIWLGTPLRYQRELKNINYNAYNWVEPVQNDVTVVGCKASAIL